MLSVVLLALLVLLVLPLLDVVVVLPLVLLAVDTTVQGWPEPVAPLFDVGSSPEVHQLAT